MRASRVIGWTLAASAFTTLGAAAAQQPPAAPAGPGASSPSADSTAVNREQATLGGYFAVPEIPAVTFLDASSAKVTRPVTPRDFVAALVEAVDEDGRIQQGFALEGALSLLPAFRPTQEQYMRGGLPYVLANTLISIATVQSSGDTTDTDFGIGARAVLLDRGDPFRNREYTTRLGAALRSCRPGAPPENIPQPGQQPSEAQRVALEEELRARREVQLACLADVTDKLAREAAATNWNTPRVTIAYAARIRLEESKLSERTHTGDRYWAVASYPLARAVQGIGYVDYTHHRRVDDVDAFDVLTYGGRINGGSATLNFFYEILGERRTDAPAAVRSQSSSWSAGIEFLATEGLWISTGFGERAQEALQPDRTVIIANIRWGLSRKAFLSPTPGGAR
jgi:hypothetical protein